MLHVILILVFLTRRIESSTSTSINNRRTLLHQPFFPVDSVPPPPTTTQQPPLIPLPPPSPRHHHHSKLPKQKKPNHPFSSQTPPPYNHRLDDHEHFFPTYTSPPSPPPSHSSPSKSVPTFPANISSISLPPSSSSKPISLKLIAITVSLVSAALIALLAASILYRRRRHKHIHPKLPRSDSLRLYPSNTATSDKPPPPLPPPPPPPPRNPSNNSAEFLYLGTLANPPTATDFGSKSITLSNVAGGSSSVLGYQRLGSPELHPLPPLPRYNYSRNAQVGSFDDDEDDVDVEFFSPKASPDGNESSSRTASQAAQGLKIRNRSNSNSKTVPSSDSASPARTMSSSPSSLKSNTPVDFPPSPQQEGNAPSPSPSSPERISGDTQNSPARVSNFTRQQYVLAPEPPPMPPVGFSETTVVPPSPWSQDPVDGPPVLSPPTRSQNPNPTENLENVMEIQKPKLKALHWDKVKASSSNRAMVWDQLKSSTSFQLNEEMMETLFMAKSTNSTAPKSRMFLPTMNHENRRRLLDPKKSQNIAILLRALNVTIDEVCEGLLEGNIDTLGTELLESLLKMAPTKEEEHNLREFNDASPSKLDPVEKFLKALLDVPFAFKRVDALLYIANFDSEVEYLSRSFETLEAACDELRNSRMFLKLLEAVLKTGNRMNVGTNRGDAHAFKLDTLLKLVDVKGTDGRTTLLHFVVQEIIRAEGSRLSVPNHNPKAEIEIDQQSELRDDVEFRKLGLEVVSGLSGELSSVKKAAAMDSHVLYSEVGKLATGITKIGEVFRLNEELGPSASYKKFTDSMNGFLKKAKNCIIKIQAQESVALSMVKETTEYFHGNSTKEEAHPFRIFMVVRDFLSTLDQVCKEVGKINERTIVSSSRQFQTPLNQSLPAVFPQFHFQGRHQYSSSADEISSSP